MKTQLIKSAFIVMLLSLFSSFSSFAMEAEVITEEHIIPEEEYCEAKEILGILNTTNKPVFINGHQLNPNTNHFQNITEHWLDNLDPVSAADFPEVFTCYLNRAVDANPFSDITLYINRKTGKARVIFNIFNRYTQPLNFDLTAAWEKGLDVLFKTVVKDDSTKPEGNFEKTYFELVGIELNSFGIIKEVERILSNEELHLAPAA